MKKKLEYNCNSEHEALLANEKHGNLNDINSFIINLKTNLNFICWSLDIPR